MSKNADLFRSALEVGIDGYPDDEDEPEWNGCTACYSENDREGANIQVDCDAPVRRVLSMCVPSGH